MTAKYRSYIIETMNGKRGSGLSQGRSVALALLCSTLLFTCRKPSASSTVEQSGGASPSTGTVYEVQRVIDGDTVELSSGTHLRYLGINTPEKKEPYFENATLYNQKLVMGKRVRVEMDVQPYDSYGRLLGFVFVDRVNINVELVRAGMAHVMIIPPNLKYAEVLQKAQEEARIAGRGIWTLLEYQAPLKLTSFHYNPPGDEAADPNREYLRLVNLTGEPLNLQGYILKDSDGHSLTFPDLELSPGYTLVVHSGKGKNQTSPEYQQEIYWQSDVPVWNNDGDELQLYDAAGKLILRRSYRGGQK